MSNYLLEGDPGQVERVYKKCPECKGNGWLGGICGGETDKCPHCDGHGTIEADTDNDEEFRYKFETEK